MDHQQFYNLVVAVRRAQKDYYEFRKSHKDRSSDDECKKLLKQSMFLESVLDIEIKRVEEILGRNRENQDRLKQFCLKAYEIGGRIKDFLEDISTKTDS